MKNEFEKWLSTVAKMKNGKNYKTASVNHYVSAIDSIHKEFGVNLWSFESVTDLMLKREQLLINNSFVEKNSKGKSMYSCAIDRLIDYVYDINNESTITEIKKIESDNTLSYDEKNSYIETLCNMRNPQFQRNFRKELINEFKGKCALCEINDKRLLVASHIIPYSECENKPDMYRSYNGLLLCIDHDFLFDKHLISFDNDGKIHINKTINKEFFDLLNISNDIVLPDSYITKERKQCLKSHYEVYKKKDGINIE